MTNQSLLDMLHDAVRTHGSQAKVARMLGYSSTTISQVLSGKYIGELGQVLTRVEEVFGTEEFDCPVLGSIPLNRCVTERRRDFTTANPQMVRLYRECRRCPNNTDSQEDF